jgi:cell division protein ZapE
MDTKEIILDKSQNVAMERLNLLHESIVSESKKGFFEKWIASKEKSLQGVYLYGDVGRGKTMLMDMFYNKLPSSIKKRRVHFHVFIKEVHDFLHEYRSNNDMDKAFPRLAGSIKSSIDVLCFDEFHIEDVADAMILSRLFTALFKHGLQIVLTSNWQPDRLYLNGLQRDRILPFISLIKDRMDIVELGGDTDYRKLMLQGRDTYFYPLNKKSEQSISNIISNLAIGKDSQEQVVSVKGREIIIKETYGDIAVFDFNDLCGLPLGTQDYLEMVKIFKVIILKNIPIFEEENRNEAKRFVNLIDIIYDAHISFIASAETNPYNLYKGSSHSFEFDRTVSRLIEMQGDKWID